MSTNTDLLCGRYALGAVLGEGAMARVYAAHDLDTGRHVAIKLIHAHVNQAPANVVRFRREATIMRRLAHPGVVTIYDAAEDPATGAMFLVMERLEGTTFEAMLLEGAATRAKALEIIRAVLPPLFAAHEAGVVHRDLKPANVFVTEHAGRPKVKLLDFGIASLDDGGPRATRTEMTLGTPSYMSPDQALRVAEAGPPADLWSVGVMLYLVIAGRLPFVGEGAYDTVMQACVQPHPPLPVGVPSVLAALVDQCLEKSPGQRPESAREIAVALDAALRRPEVKAYLDALDRTAPIAAAAPTAPKVEDEAPAPSPTDAPTIRPPKPEPRRAAEPRAATVTVRPEAALAPPLVRGWPVRTAGAVMIAFALLVYFVVPTFLPPRRAALVFEATPEPEPTPRAGDALAFVGPAIEVDAFVGPPSLAPRTAAGASTRAASPPPPASAVTPALARKAEASADGHEPSTAPRVPDERDASRHVPEPLLDPSGDVVAGAATVAATPVASAQVEAEPLPPDPAPVSSPERAAPEVAQTPEPAPEDAVPRARSEPSRPLGRRSEARPAEPDPEPTDFSTF